MNTNATGASARQSGFSAHAVPRNSPAAMSTAAHACASVSRPDGSSRARVRGFFASRSRSAIRLKPSATQRAHVNASTTSASSRHVTGCSRDATSKPSSANGSANRVWGSLTKLTYRTRRLPPAKVWPSRRTSELDAKLPPHRVHLLLRLWIHHDPVRPLAREPFFLPFASGVDAHLRAEGEGAAGVVEHVDRPQGEPHVALGVDVVERHPPRLPRVLNVHILIEHDDHLGERHQPLPPETVHDLVRLTGILLVDAHEDEVVKDPRRRHVDVHDFGDRELEERQEDPLGRMPEPVILHRRAADAPVGPDRAPAHRPPPGAPPRGARPARRGPRGGAPPALPPPLLPPDRVSLPDHPRPR